MFRCLSLICVFLTGCASTNRIKPEPNPSVTYLSGTGLITAAKYLPTNSSDAIQCMCLIRDSDTKCEDRFMIVPSSVDEQFGFHVPPLNTYEIILHCSYRVQKVENTFDPPTVILLDCLITNINYTLDGELLGVKCDPPIVPNQLFMLLEEVKNEKAKNGTPDRINSSL